MGLLSFAARIVTLPVDVVNSGADILNGGSGRKRSRTQIPVLGEIEKIRDRVVEEIKEVEDDL